MVECWSTMSSAGVFDVQCHLHKRYNWGLSVSNENFLFLLCPKICLIEPKEIFEYNESKIPSLRQLQFLHTRCIQVSADANNRDRHANMHLHGHTDEDTSVFLYVSAHLLRKRHFGMVTSLRTHVFLSAWLSYLILIQDRWGVKSRHLLDIMYTRGWPLQPYMNLIELIELNWTGYFLREYICALFANFIQTNNPWLNKCQITASTNTTGC